MKYIHKFLLPLIALAVIGGCNKGVFVPQEDLKSLPYRPLRIVSINPCADAILLSVADKSQITAISHYSHDKRASSIDLKTAAQFPHSYDTAEEIISFKPDLVVAGSHVALPTINALQRLKIPMVNLKVPNTIEESKEQITLLANLTGNPQNGINLNNKIDAKVTEVKSNTKTSAIIWQGDGLVPGTGTLADELLTTAGFENQSSKYGLSQWDILPIEPLINNPPEFILTNLDANKSDRLLSHPIMQKAAIVKSGEKIKVVDFRPKYLTCAGPVMIDALTRLHQIKTLEN